jgi:2-iminobutanoate/2-iminopropanoate deaminase
MTTRARSWQPVTTGEGIAAPAGAYSPGARAGNLLFVSGQIPKDPSTGRVVDGGITEQTRQTIENVRAVLTAGGASLTDLVMVTVYLADENDWGAFNDVYKSMMTPPFPCRAVVGAQLRGILVEISAVASVSA